MLFSSLHAGPPDTCGRASTSSTLIQVTLGSSRENSFVLCTFRVSPSEPVHESWVKRLGHQGPGENLSLQEYLEAQPQKHAKSVSPVFQTILCILITRPYCG